MTIVVGGLVVHPGERREILVPLGSRPDGTVLGVPLIGVAGKRPGPVLGITTGVHGDEYEGPEAVRLLLDGLNPDDLSGGIVCTPVANLSAYETASRVGGVDYLDLNRSFPGDATGFLTQRVAATIVREIVEQAHALVDLHSAGLAYDLEPYVGFNSSPGVTGERSFDLAKVFGIRLLYGSTPFPNVLRLEAAKREIPAILVESGGEGRLRPDKVQTMVRGLRNVLQHLGMVQGEPEGLPDRYMLLQAAPEGEFGHIPTGGFIRNRALLGGLVRAGDHLATIVDAFGKELARVESPLDGLVLSYRTLPVARIGEWGYSIVRVVGEFGSDVTMTQALGGKE